MTLPPGTDEKAHQKKVQQKTQGRYNKDQGKLLFSAVADATVKNKAIGRNIVADRGTKISKAC